MRGQPHAPAAHNPGKDPVPTVQEAGWAQGPVWTGEENLAPTGIRSPHSPARSESLYRLSYRALTGIMKPLKSPKFSNNLQKVLILESCIYKDIKNRLNS